MGNPDRGPAPPCRSQHPHDKREVAALIARYKEIGSLFHPSGEQGDQIKAAARRMWQENSTELSTRLPWPPDRIIALVAYINQTDNPHQTPRR